MEFVKEMGSYPLPEYMMHVSLMQITLPHMKIFSSIIYLSIARYDWWRKGAVVLSQSWLELGSQLQQ